MRTIASLVPPRPGDAGVVGVEGRGGAQGPGARLDPAWFPPVLPGRGGPGTQGVCVEAGDGVWYMHGT